MQIVEDAEYNGTYPERPKRYVMTETGAVGPTFITEDAIAPSLAKAEADVVKWTEIQTTVAAM